MTTEENATYFEETVRKSINPKKQADYISINEKGTAAKLGDNEIERIINAAIVVEYEGARYEWQIEDGKPITIPTGMRICLKNMKKAALELGDNIEYKQHVFFPNKEQEETFSIFGIVENEEFAVAFSYNPNKEEIKYVCEDKMINGASDLYAIVRDAWMEGMKDGRKETVNTQGETNDQEYICSEMPW